jgi:SAM-dependent methyltransferase
MSVDFSSIADVYDQTRLIPQDVLNRALDRVQEELPSTVRRVLDVGAGTGQIAVGLAERGFEIVGVDVSHAMLAKARARARSAPNVVFRHGDAHALPFADSVFDVVLGSKIFQHLERPGTAVGEIVRVLRSRGAFLHIRDRGAYRNVVRRRLETLAERRGFTRRYVGMSDLDELPSLFAERGWGIRRLTTDLRWKKTVTAREAYAQIRARLFAEFWSIPQDEYTAMLGELARWIDEDLGWEAQETLHAYLALELYEKER